MHISHYVLGPYREGRHMPPAYPHYPPYAGYPRRVGASRSPVRNGRRAEYDDEQLDSVSNRKYETTSAAGKKPFRRA